MTQPLNDDGEALAIPIGQGLFGNARKASDKPDDFTDAERKEVEEETQNLRDWLSQLSGDDIKSGNWFSRLIAHALSTYTKTANYEWFQEKYEGAPPDVIVNQRIKMAARYAALEGAASAAAYSGAVVLTIGSLGGASPLTLPAAAATFVIDLTFTTQLQVRLAHDIAVLYRVPIDIDDPDDLWDLIKVAFSIKGGELMREGVLKAVPVVVRPIVKKIFSGGTLKAAQSLPVIGTHLLQRNLIKFGIPLVGVPLATALNYWTTRLAGSHARQVYRNDARVIELAERLSERTRHPKLLLWIAWLVIQADPGIEDDEALLFRHLTRLIKENHQIEDEQLAKVVDTDEDDIWRRVEEEEGDLSDLVKAAELIAGVDGKITATERRVVDELEHRAFRL